MGNSVLRDRSYEFALKSVRLGYELIEKREFILSKQFIRSATSIGANMEEGLVPILEKNFFTKLLSLTKKLGRLNFGSNY